MRYFIISYINRGRSKINVFLRIYLLPFKKLCMVVSFSKIIMDGRCDISLRLLCKFQNDRFFGAANGHQNWNIMIWNLLMLCIIGKEILINFYKISTSLKWIVFKLYIFNFSYSATLLIYLIVESDRYYSGWVYDL